MKIIVRAIAKRLPVISLAGVMLALIVYGGGTSANLLNRAGAATEAPQAANLPATRPVVRAEVNATAAEGLQGSLCWPRSDAGPQCDFVDDPQPTTSISVAAGDTIKFTVDPAAPPPSRLLGTLLDDKDADGEAPRVDLLSAGGVFTVQYLTDGAHRLQVQAIYTGEAAGSQPYVSYVFRLQVGTGVAMATASVVPTVESTGAPTGGTSEAPTAVTAESTAAAATTEAPSEAATPTEVPTAIATAGPVGTEAATAEVTTPAPSTPEVTVPTEIATQPVENTPIPTETEAATLIFPPTTTAVPTSAVVTPETGGAVVIPMTQVPTEAVTPQAPVAPTTTGTPEVGAVLQPTPETNQLPTEVATSVAPELTMTVGGRTYEPIAVNACVLGQDGSTTCVNRPRNAAAERMFAAPGDVAQVSFKGPRPLAVTVTIASSDGTAVLNKQNLRPDNLMLYTLPSTGGNYVLAVEVAWSTGKSTYYYRLTVGS